MSFRAVFVALVVGLGPVPAGFLINRQRPPAESEQPTAALVRASGKCAECHARQQHSVVYGYELGAHARKGVTCLDCHQPAERQEKVDHRGFVIGKSLTAGNCRNCHPAVYEQYLRSRHAAPSWAAVYGEKGSPDRPLTPEQVDFGEQFRPGSCRRPANALHARNGFFHATEWVPVVSSALAVGFLLSPFVTPVGRGYLRLCAAVLLARAAVGLLGFYLHAEADLRGPEPSR